MNKRLKDFLIRYLFIVGLAYWLLKTYSPNDVYLLYFVIPGYIVYFLPDIIAEIRGHHNSKSISVVNLFLGWTLIGWVVAFAWSMSAIAQEKRL